MLIVDEHTAHMTGEIRPAIAECNTVLEFVPGGYTAKLQCMDVGLNKPFKDRVRDQFDHWLASKLEAAQPEATIKPTREDVAIWINNAWLKMKKRTMANTWRRIGIDHSILLEEDGEEEEETAEVASSAMKHW